MEAVETIPDSMILQLKQLQRLCLLALLAMGLQGCKTISTSFDFDQRILVKVPCTGELPARAETNGWRFKLLMVASATNNLQPLPATWYLAWPPDGPRYQLRHRSTSQTWRVIRRMTPEVADVVHEAFGQYPMVIEPNLIFGMHAIAPALTNITSAQEPPPGLREVTAHDPPSSVWPEKKTPGGELEPLWYLGDQFTQLRTALQIVQSNAPEHAAAIRIGILDCGYDSSHYAMPEHVEDDPEANAVNWLQNPGDVKPIPPGATGTAHGTGTMSILAGRKVRLLPDAKGPQFAPIEGYLGGAPHATIVPVLVAPWVFSLETADLAYGIDYASRVKHCDVISMSHGGAPSLIWADAVNSAYNRGTAIFAATGDFYSLVGTDMGILVPSYTVYPAGFRSVMGVTGVTEVGKTYAKNGFWNLLPHLFSLSAWEEWLFRGCYGADMQARWLFGYMNDPDPAQKWDNGILHSYPIAAYSPNTAWALSSADPSASGARNLIDLDGAGTSAATPQVAAAGALWLQQNYNEINASNDWHSWRKAEAVYVALLASASRAETNQPDHYLGAGILKAANALTNDYASICAMEDTRANRRQNEATGRVPTLGFSRAPQDFYDGQRSIVQLIFPWRRQPEFKDRADLRQTPKDFSTRTDALKGLYFNGLLLEQFEKGNTPKTGDEEARLDREAKNLCDEFGSTP